MTANQMAGMRNRWKARQLQRVRDKIVRRAGTGKSTTVARCNSKNSKVLRAEGFRVYRFPPFALITWW